MDWNVRLTDFYKEFSMDNVKSSFISASLKVSLLLSSLCVGAEALSSVTLSTVVNGSDITYRIATNPAINGEVCTRYYTLPDTTTGSSVMPATVAVHIPPISFGYSSQTVTNQQSGTHTSYVSCPITGTSATVSTVVP